MSELIGAAVGGLIAIISGTTVAVVTNSLMARRAYEEKIWELKRTAYGSIFAGLTAVELVLDHIEDSLENSNYETYYRTDAYKKHSKQIADIMIEVKSTYTCNYLILSPQFIEVFDAFLKDIADDPCALPPDNDETFASAVRAVRPKLLEQARKEIPLKEGKVRFF